MYKAKCNSALCYGNSTKQNNNENINIRFADIHTIANAIKSKFLFVTMCLYYQRLK